jgi:hypothetical protein
MLIGFLPVDFTGAETYLARSYKTDQLPGLPGDAVNLSKDTVAGFLDMPE